MKVAICISGHMRCYKSVVESQLNNIIQPNECDVFIATWDKIGVRREVASGIHPQEVDDPLEIDEVKVAYGPALKSMRVFNIEAIQPTLVSTLHVSMVNMFWLMKECHLLLCEYEVKNNIRYDMVIRSRPDLLFHTGFLLPQTSLPSDSIFVPPLFTEDIVGDVLAAGTRVVMEHYNTIFLYLEEYSKRTWPQLPGTACLGVWPEQILRTHIREQSLKLVELPITYEVHRNGYPFVNASAGR